MSIDCYNSDKSLPVNKSNINGSIYLYKNDPKVVNKGVNVSNFRHAQGGFLPLLADANYTERKLDNLAYSYDDKIHHGSRPLHKTTFSIKHDEYQSEFASQNKSEFKGIQLRSEQLGVQGSDQFKSQFDLGMRSNERNFLTSYQNQFYLKNTDETYQKNFDIMPKYSLPKQIYQLEHNKLKERETDIKKTIKMSQNEPTYWTQYNSSHNYLGLKRGPGEPKEYPDRPSYNIFTGEKLNTPAWSFKQRYNRVSGDAQLHSTRKQDKNILN